MSRRKKVINHSIKQTSKEEKNEHRKGGGMERMNEYKGRKQGREKEGRKGHRGRGKERRNGAHILSLSLSLFMKGGKGMKFWLLIGSLVAAGQT